MLYYVLFLFPAVSTKSVIRCQTDGQLLATRQICSANYYLCQDVKLFTKDFHKARVAKKCPFPLIFSRGKLECENPKESSECDEFFSSLGAEIAMIKALDSEVADLFCNEYISNSKPVFNYLPCETEFEVCLHGRSYKTRCIDSGNEFNGRRCVPASKSCWGQLLSESDLEEVSAYNYGPLEDEDICLHRDDPYRSIMANRCDKFFIKCTDDDNSRIYRCPRGSHAQSAEDFPICRKSSDCLEVEGSGSQPDSDEEYRRIFGNWILLEEA